ncbi:MAG TPA: hypothetical protein DD434_13790 [Bacteroidales bacterium]|nr:hypothetical protein [Bacteroidales bacterium]
MSKRKTPILRFKGFNNAWEQRKLGDIAKIVGGGTPSTKNSQYWNGNINWYSPTEIGKNAFVNESKKKITKAGLQHSSAKLLLKNKTILFTSRANIGDLAIMTSDGATNQGFQSWVIDQLKIDIYFLYSLGNILKNQAIKLAYGSTFLEISNKNVKNLQLKIPNIQEQKKIGSLFKIIDELLTLQKRKYEELKLIKKFLLQNMFADKVPYPNLRFNNFTSEWKLQYLGKLFRRNNERNKKNIFKIDHTITVSKMKFNINGNGAAPTSICTYKVLRTGDVAFEGNRHTKYPFGQLIINDIGDGIMSPRFASIRPKYKLNISYWKYFLHYEPLVHNILVMSTKSGTLMNELVYSDLFKQNIFLPENSEQIKIGKILNIIDYKINLQKRYILKLKSIKNFLLQNMFV